uniref:Uncharacterized protein n=1 Tax=Avena sativa TaxID=4498 RepID=A0ACD6AMT0_AVESA
MASLPQPMPYSYYPSPGSVRHAGRATPDDEGRGSFGPVLVVLAVITFLATAACIAGRLCGRRSSPTGKSSSADAEKGLGAKHPAAAAAAMRPLPSSRATVHDVLDDDVFEIKFAHVKPAGMGPERDGGTDGGGRVQALLPPPQLGLPRQYAAPGFRCAPANGGGGVTGVARQAPHPQARAAGGQSCTPPTMNQSR